MNTKYQPRITVGGLTVVVALATGLSGNVAQAKYDWLQFGFTPDMAANDSFETTLNVGNVSGLKPLFKVPLSDAPDGTPVLLSDVTTPSGVKDLVYIFGEHGNLTAFDAHTGAQVWTHNFGPGGITNSAPAIDPNRQFIYVNAPDGSAHKVRVGDGVEVTGGGWPEMAGPGKSSCELTIATGKDGHKYLYTANQGHGHITTINLDTGTQHVFNLSNSNEPDTHSPSGSVAGAAPWSRGIAYDATLDRVFVMGGTNNGTTFVPGQVWRQSYIALPADGSTKMINGGGYPVDSYTPTDWAAGVSSDVDIGSGGLVILPVGLSSKYPHLGVQAGKDKKIRLLNLADMSGQGGPGHTGGEVFVYSFDAMQNMRSEGATWTNPADGVVWAFVTGHSGIAGFQVVVDGAGNPSLSLKWTNFNGWTTSAIVANGVVFACAGGGEHTDTLTVHQIQALNPTTGALLWTAPLGQFHWASPIVANGIVYMVDGNSGGHGSGTTGDLMAWQLNNPPVAAPVFTPPGGTYDSAQNVAISTTTSGASIRYTTDGSTPTPTTGTPYTGLVAISTTTTLKAIAFAPGMTDSSVTSATYTITTAATAPTFTPTPGSYATTQNVTITTPTSGATIYYTVDGSTPSATNGTVYSNPVAISATTTLKAIASKSGLADSPVTSGLYTIGTPPTLTYEAEALKYTGNGATASVQTDTKSSGGKWVELAGNSVGDYIEFNLPSIPAGTYQVQMEWKGNNNRGILSFKIDGTQLGGTLNQYASGQTYPTTTLGTTTFANAGTHVIRLTVTGKSSSSSSYVLSADRFILTGQ